MRLLLVPHAATRIGVRVHAFCMQGVELIKFVSQFGNRNGENDDLPDLYLRLTCWSVSFSCMFYKAFNIRSGDIKNRMVTLKSS